MQGLIGAALLVIDVHRVVRVFSFEVNCLYLSFPFGFLVVKGIVNVLNRNRKTLQALFERRHHAILFCLR